MVHQYVVLCTQWGRYLWAGMKWFPDNIFILVEKKEGMNYYV